MIDASVALAWSLDDDSTDDALEALEHVEIHGGIAPTLWTYEVANVLALLVRRQRLDLRHASEIGAALDALRIITVPPEGAGWRKTTSALAERHALTVYDASYLALALANGALLATTDRALRVAAEAHMAAFPMKPPCRRE